MCKRLCSILTIILLLSIFGCAPKVSDNSSLDMMPIGGSVEMVGLYCFEFWPEYADFWKSCGINTLQYTVNGAGLAENPQALQEYCDKFTEDIRLAQEKGFQVYVGFLTNFRIAQEDEPSWQACFDPRDEVLMQKRLEVLAKTVQACKQADGFSILCGDPGGFAYIPNVEADVSTYINLCKRFIQVIQTYAPNKPININPWAISNFQTPILNPYTLEYWLQETELTKILLADPDLVGANIGIELACSDYYRSLTLRQYAKEYRREDFPTYPKKEDLEALYQRGCERRWAWPYFLLDECDNGDGAGEGVQLETRYIRDMVNRLKDIGINGIFGNWALAGRYTRALNMYAFCRFCEDPSLTEEQVIREYAAKNVTPEFVEALTKALMYIENHSHWHSTMPAKARLDPLKTVNSAREALALLEGVIPLEKAEGVAEAPSVYVSRVVDRLQVLASNE